MSTSKDIARDGHRSHVERARTWIESLGPHQSLVLLAVPTCLVEPLKFVAVAVAGDGHWITGTCMIVAAYATSLVVLERLFLIVKPKLLILPWFAWAWGGFTALRARFFNLIGWGKTSREAVT